MKTLRSNICWSTVIGWWWTVASWHCSTATSIVFLKPLIVVVRKCVKYALIAYTYQLEDKTSQNNCRHWKCQNCWHYPESGICVLLPSSYFNIPLPHPELKDRCLFGVCFEFRVSGQFSGHFLFVFSFDTCLVSGPHPGGAQQVAVNWWWDLGKNHRPGAEQVNRVMLMLMIRMLIIMMEIVIRRFWACSIFFKISYKKACFCFDVNDNFSMIWICQFLILFSQTSGEGIRPGASPYCERKWWWFWWVQVGFLHKSHQWWRCSSSSWMHGTWPWHDAITDGGSTAMHSKLYPGDWIIDLSLTSCPPRAPCGANKGIFCKCRIHKRWGVFSIFYKNTHCAGFVPLDKLECGNKIKRPEICISREVDNVLPKLVIC